MTDKPQPRDFWVSGWDPHGFPLKSNNAITVFVTKDRQENPAEFRVIEHSAYEHLKALFIESTNKCLKLAFKYDEATDYLLAISRERNELKAELERYKRALDKLAAAGSKLKQWAQDTSMYAGPIKGVCVEIQDILEGKTE